MSSDGISGVGFRKEIGSLRVARETTHARALNADASRVGARKSEARSPSPAMLARLASPEPPDPRAGRAALCHTACMQFSVSIYYPGTTPVHRLDARVKLVLLLAYSITLFFVHTWIGLGMCIAACSALMLLSRIPLRRMATLLVPVYVILAFTLLFNSFSLDVNHVVSGYGMGDVSAGAFAGLAPIPLAGSFGFVPEGFARGCFYALRIVFLVLASFVVCFTTTSNDLTDALNDFLKPLRALRVPTQDIAMMISIALRFIPVTAEEFVQVRAAQWARGAAFSTGTLIERLRAWQTVLIPLFVGLFRRADNLAVAMEARCYGLGEERTELNPRRFAGASAAVLALGLAACASLAWAF